MVFWYNGCMENNQSTNNKINSVKRASVKGLFSLLMAFIIAITIFLSINNELGCITQGGFTCGFARPAIHFILLIQIVLLLTFLILSVLKERTNKIIISIFFLSFFVEIVLTILALRLT